MTARELLARQELIDVYFKEKRWAEVAALVRFARRDVPAALASNDPRSTGRCASKSPASS